MPTIAFIKKGRFSHTNDSVHRMLANGFPGVRIRSIDVEELLTAHPAVRARNLLHVVGLYGPAILRRRHSVGACMFRTPFVFGAIRDMVTEAIHDDPDPLLFTIQTQSLFDAHIDGVPHFVYTDHTHLANLTYPGFDRAKLFAPSWIELERRIYAHATLTFTMSRHVERSIIDQYGGDPRRIACIFAGANVETALLSHPHDYTGRNILFVGREWVRKGGPEVVEAFRIVRKRFADATLTVVGCSPAIDTPGCSVVGPVPLDRVPAYYARASVFCMPTRVEPFGIVFVEALAHGLPVVATNIGALPDIVDRESGRLVNSGNVGDLADALLYFLEDEARRRTAGEAGRRLVRERFTWDAVGARLTRGIELALAVS